MIRFRLWWDDPETAGLKNHMQRLSDALREVEALIQETVEVEEQTRRTSTVIRDRRRSFTGSIPLSPYYDICAALHLDPDERFPSDLKGVEAKNESAVAGNLRIRADALLQAAQIRRQIHRLEQMLRCAGSRSGTLDYEVFCVLKRYFEADVDLTIDEAVGIALAGAYQRTRSVAELTRLAMRGQFALREVGNCAADAVFDPDLRKRMAGRYRQLGQWGSHKVMKEYLKITEEGDEHSSVKAYVVKSDALRELPEYILYGLVVLGDGHAMRVLDVESDGLRVVEGNWNGDLRLGRFVPFGEVTWGDNDVTVFARQPRDRHGLERELTVYDYMDPDATGYDSLQEITDDLGSFALFKVMSRDALNRLPLRIRDSLTVMAFFSGKSYSITHYSALIDCADVLFPKCTREDVVAALVDAACENPTGMLVVIATRENPADHLPLSWPTRGLTAQVARQMYVYWDKEGGEQTSLFIVQQVLESMRSDGETMPRILLLSREEFVSLNEDARRETAILTPRRDETGRHVAAESYWEMRLMRVCPDDPDMLMDDEHKEPVAIRELMQNPFRALVVQEGAFHMLGIGSRLTREEHALSDPLRLNKADVKKNLMRTVAIRQEHKSHG